MAYSKLEPEASLETTPPHQPPPPDWPSQGALSLTDVAFRYSPELPLVLKNLSFSIKPSEKANTTLSLSVCLSVCLSVSHTHSFCWTVTDWYCGADWGREIVSDLCSVPPGRAIWTGTGGWGRLQGNRAARPAQTYLNHPSGLHQEGGSEGGE